MMQKKNGQKQSLVVIWRIPRNMLLGYLKTCFIYHSSEKLKKGYRIIRNDPFNVRNGEILRMFENENEIQKEFSGYFKNFIFGSIHDDCFGYDYHWHLVVCQKKKNL